MGGWWFSSVQERSQENFFLSRTIFSSLIKIYLLSDHYKSFSGLNIWSHNSAPHRLQSLKKKGSLLIFLTAKVVDKRGKPIEELKLGENPPAVFEGK
jgi:hypothetical protein